MCPTHLNLDPGLEADPVGDGGLEVRYGVELFLDLRRDRWLGEVGATRLWRHKHEPGCFFSAVSFPLCQMKIRTVYLTMVRSLRGGGLCLDPTSVEGKEIMNYVELFEKSIEQDSTWATRNSVKGIPLGKNFSKVALTPGLIGKVLKQGGGSLLPKGNMQIDLEQTIHFRTNKSIQ